MKSCGIGIVICLLLLVPPRAQGQAQEVQQLLLNVEKLAQLRNILDDLKKGYEIVSQGYTGIRNIAAGNFRLHQAFLDGLQEVSPAVKNYRRIADIIRTQITIVGEYKNAFRQFSESGHFSPDELSYLKRVYENLLQRSLQSLEALAMVVTAGRLRMSDDERLTSIDAIWKDISDNLQFLRHFNQESKLFLLQKTKAAADLKTAQKLFTNK